MADHPPKENTDTIEELVIRNSYEIVALVSLLEKKGILTRAEIIDEIRSLNKHDQS